MLAWITVHLTWDARFAHKMWSVRIGLIWAVVEGLWVGIPAFQFSMPPLYFVSLCILVSVIVAFARITHQPGLSDDRGSE